MEEWAHKNLTFSALCLCGMHVFDVRSNHCLVIKLSCMKGVDFPLKTACMRYWWVHDVVSKLWQVKKRPNALEGTCHNIRWPGYSILTFLNLYCYFFYSPFPVIWQSQKDWRLKNKENNGAAMKWLSVHCLPYCCTEPSQEPPSTNIPGNQSAQN